MWQFFEVINCHNISSFLHMETVKLCTAMTFSVFRGATIMWENISTTNPKHRLNLKRNTLEERHTYSYFQLGHPTPTVSVNKLGWRQKTLTVAAVQQAWTPPLPPPALSPGPLLSQTSCTSEATGQERGAGFVFCIIKISKG